ncbi:hypothetical protein B0T10DRAFT_458748 [Thelonectria olida]|uniref:Uncharacterized protein n=1 Tax=Thelonectria olida TaxID=1576542 RepID=A0A9P8W5K7_9HYPO|nr:hypothetical protein B0T10DRAFT_458748 [Thelonectria olida]
MHSVKLFATAALALGASTVSAASTCTKDVKITEPTQTVNCDVVDADITISSSISGDVTINGPKQIKGDFIANNASSLISLTSTTINSITGTFQLQNLEKLSTLEFSSLKSVGEITLVKLPQLSSLNFGTEGVTKINSIQITDTFISDLSGLSVATVENFQIDNNKQITKFESDLVNITGTLIINNNGNDFQISMKELELAGEFQISNIKSFSAPLLAKLTKSLKFDKNDELTSFAAPNLTSIADDVSFINNKKLTNISMPALTTIDGGFTIQNNTAMKAISGFDELKNVTGAIILRGNFSKVTLPSLESVAGTVTVTSTTDISSFCDFFKDLKDDGKIEGEETCTWNNKEANEDNGNGGDSSSDSSDDNEDAAGMTSVSFAVLGLTAIAAMFQLL